MPKPSNNVDPKPWLFALFVLSVLLMAFLNLRGTGSVKIRFCRANILLRRPACWLPRRQALSR